LAYRSAAVITGRAHDDLPHAAADSGHHDPVEERGAGGQVVVHPVQRDLAPGRHVGGQGVVSGGIAVGRGHPGNAQPVRRDLTGRYRGTAAFQPRRHRFILPPASVPGRDWRMTSDSAHRGIRLDRIANSKYTASNERGGQVSMGTGEDADFTPVELLLAAIGGCTAVDVDILTSRRAEPDRFEVTVDADKARALLPDAVRMSHDRLCTVGRTVELGTPIATRIE
jgi:putative redox protein